MSAHARIDGQKSSSCKHTMHAITKQTCAMHWEQTVELGHGEMKLIFGFGVSQPMLLLKRAHMHDAEKVKDFFPKPNPSAGCTRNDR